MNLTKTLAAAAVAAAGVAGANAAQAQQTSLTVCSGGSGGNYEFAANALKDVSGGLLTVINTKGSWDNIEKMEAGECDVAIVQEDAIMLAKTKHMDNFSAMNTLFREHLLMICTPGNGITDVTDLLGNKPPKIISLGDEGSGAWVSWNYLQIADERYKQVVTEAISGRKAFAQVAEGEIDCVLNISAPNNATLLERDANYGTTTDMIEFTDNDLFDVPGVKRGSYLYQADTVPGENFPNWLDGRSKFSSGDMKGTSIAARLIVSDRVDDKTADRVLATVEKAQAKITAHVAPK